MKAVDCQSHVFPKKYAEILLRNNTWITARKADDAYVVTYGEGMQTFTIRPEVYDIRSKLEDMDRNEIDVSVLSVNIPGPELLSPELGIEAARICNDEVSALCGLYPGRLAGLALIPWQDIDSALAELKRAVERLELRGLLLFSHLNGKPVDSPEFDAIYSYVEEHRIPLVIHPTVPVWGDVIKEYSMIPMFGMMVDTSIAMLRLILGGVLERHPDLLVVHPHCGGVIPYLMPRIVEQTEVKGRGRDNITKSPAEYYDGVYLDIVSPSPRAMRYAYDSSSPERLLFGSDHPWVRIETIIEYVKAMDIPERHKAMMMGENAVKLFRLDR